MDTHSDDVASRMYASSRSREVVKRVEPVVAAELAKQGLQLGAHMYIRIFKEERLLEVWLKKDTRYVRAYLWPIAAMSGTLGPKMREGDGQAPEGFYEISESSMHPTSRFHLAFNIGYPNAYDRGLKRTGSFIMIHGNKVSIGCFAMTDPVIEKLWLLAGHAFRHQNVVPVHIFPFRMTEGNMQRHAKNPWFSFWKECQPAYDAFEKHAVPPVVSVRDGHYVLRDEAVQAVTAPQAVSPRKGVR